MEDQIMTPKKRRPTILYTDIFYNTLTFLHFSTNQSLLRGKKANFALCKRCRKPCRFCKLDPPDNCQHLTWSQFAC